MWAVVLCFSDFVLIHVDMYPMISTEAFFK